MQRFGKHYSYHLQDEYAVVWRFWKPYTGQTVGGKFDYHAQPLNIHPKDGNCNVCRNVG
jgi:hypothetical protein